MPDHLKCPVCGAEVLAIVQQRDDDRAIMIVAATLIVADRIAELAWTIASSQNTEPTSRDRLLPDQAADHAAAILNRERARHA